MSARTINVEALARVEGEGGLTIRVRGGRVQDVQLRIYEPPRFFEALLRGRSLMEAPDITARICGICPVAYQMSACQAMEDAVGMSVTEPIHALRRLLYCGEWIESHALHVFLLHAPDYLGFADAFQMAQKHGEVVKNALRMKKAGNTLMAVIGGREIHPINVRVGGFHRAPRSAELHALLPELHWARDNALTSLRWLGALPIPELERDYTCVALHHPDEYPIIHGHIRSNAGLDITAAEYDQHFTEEQVPHSTALHSILRGHGAYLCGPISRFNLNHSRLPQPILQAAAAAGLTAPCTNPFKSVLVRGVEIAFAFHEAIRLIEGYQPPDPSFVEVPLRAGTGFGATEAPRGLLYHRYTVDDHGTILDARIIPPTSQNQKTMEADLWALSPRLLDMPHAEATWLAEHAVRNHDPCISCATHSLTLRIERQ